MSDALTFVVAKSFACFATDGNVKPTNSYYGNSQILRPDYKPMTVDVGTYIHVMPGGTWLDVDGKLMCFSLDDRNPSDVGSFEKHHDPTRYRWQTMQTNGTVMLVGKCDMDTFMPKYRAYGKGA